LHGATSSGETVVGEDRTGVVVLRHKAKSEVHYGDDVGSDAELLYVSGHAQSRIPFLTIHGALGVIGPLVHPKPKSMLLIGYGSGATPYAAGVNPETEVIRVIALIQPVYSVMDIFSATSANSAIRRLRDDRRIERILGDGRHFLYTDNSRYDVIQADAILP